MGGVGGEASDDDFFNTMVVLQPSVQSCGLPAKAQFIKFLSNGTLLVVPKGRDSNTIIIVSTQHMQVLKEHPN